MAALVHDPAALRDETLAQSVEAAVRLALANVRLQVDVAARVGEVAASRRRLVEAGDEQRRRLRDELRSGAERGLADVSRDLAGLAAGPQGRDGRDAPRPRAELDAARGDLARFAQGVHPRSLTEHGLAFGSGRAGRPGRDPGCPPGARAALPGSAGGGRVLRVLGGPGQRRQVRRGVWARASTSMPPAQRLIVRVADDGRGGADPRAARVCAGSPTAWRHSAARCPSTARPAAARGSPPSCRSERDPDGSDRLRSRRACSELLALAALLAVGVITVAIVRAEPDLALTGDSGAALAAELAAARAGRGGGGRHLASRRHLPDAARRGGARVACG